MDKLATNREQLLRVAEATLDVLQSETFANKIDEGTAELVAEPGAPSVDTVTSALSEALEWARLEGRTLSSEQLESVGSGPAPYVPSNQLLSLLQSAYQEHLDGIAEGVEEPFDHTDVGWAIVAYEKIKSWLKGKRKFIKHNAVTDFRLDLQANAVVALFSDWGTGEQTAIRVMQQIKNAAPTHAIHMGDVYYSGTPKEVQKRFLDVIHAHGPTKAGCRYFSLNANHDMFSGGYGYFDHILPDFGQEASYFNLRNQHWQLIGIDTGYEDHGLKDPQKDWLKAQLTGGGGKPVLVSHHQFFSSYEDRAYDRKLHRKFQENDLLPHVFAWFWGHEHKCMIFGDHQGIKARCIGHGAIPVGVPFGKPEFDLPVIASDERESPAIRGTGLHGFALLKFNGPTLDISYIDEFGTVFFSEQMSAA